MSNRNTILTSPQLRLIGSINEAMYAEFRDQLHNAPKDGPLVVAITTLGGNPEVARTMADDVRLLREPGREVYFLGKSAVYSAGATFMAGFPVSHRFMTKDSSILIHERQIAKTINLSGPLKSCTYQLKAALNEIEHSIEIEEQGFREIVEGSNVSFEEVRDRAPENWYIGCEKAKELGLICDVI
ncbi:ATP-dependent Clp protease proteolytic subunit [Aurantiacibacter poecillastricola]|uniref:ATP-dependent Clp protease proteolytic subunit n=1 Tax=Aurantiacibacter poecillastricola TaxID=3064385 RepID=UPI00273E0D4E|nr:ATP-dependent Clp protease proteolytic subunit [Aurantiacibacter sp. 219JJ12-13]MDP5261832.1 ATP-dependent Clp protease proteolytic subunit [Aurantiacibacter sp. 219JJ12-13]